MARFTGKRRQKAGLPPGTLIHVGEARVEQVRITCVRYGSDGVTETPVTRVEDLPHPPDPPGVIWVNVDGLHDVAVVEAIGRRFGIHPLTLEDILHTGQRPKLDDYDTYLYVVLKMLSYNPRNRGLDAEQVSLVLGERFLLSFQERAGDVFDPVRERIRRAKGRIRRSGCDYLAYALIDAVVDHYFAALEAFGERIEETEDELYADPDQETLGRIHDMRRQMMLFRRHVWPVRQILAGLKKEGPPLVDEETVVFLGDVSDHAVQIIDTVESFRDLLSGLLDLYLSSISNRMNEVMKVLTIIATIFIPLTFLAGIYGMNFTYMPELRWRWGYFVLWGVMLSVAGGMLIYFRRKKWI